MLAALGFFEMALDHYVSQVHLKNFYAPELGEAFYASRKQAVRIFPQSSSNVCRIEQGSTNESRFSGHLLLTRGGGTCPNTTIRERPGGLK